ncbi:flavin-containing monooxygenase [Jatrophihabitans sp.]|uniref:flavin-containing monooxygenase n=1 Tax=Jatrophihabitans sp. TaxID=1932789 RepID=UPI002B5EED13|nr:NAD(P)/FAD-dependent oxidoreductase [Jatrophihabitans sp.]
MIDTGAAPQAAAALPGRVAVLIVGAGFGGLGCAIALAADGEQDFLCIDRGSEVGGTWRDNTYPGATCDVPSQLYSFSFALNPGWSRSFSSQPEIQDYLRTVAASSGVLDRFRFGVEFLGARWDAEQALWRIETSAGPVAATLLVSAAGALSEPKLPDLPGLADFGGAVFHSARWDHRQQLAGRRVAVIGTGASAIQIVPAIAGQVARLDVYQRTAPWVLPRRDRRYRAWERLAMRRVPGLQRLLRGLVYLGREAMVPMFVAAPRLGWVASRLALANIRRAIADPALREKVRPHFALGCKRVLISSDWYPALARDHIELVTEPISHLVAGAVVTADGTARPADVLIVATGFAAAEQPIARLITGTGGRTLAQVWAERGMQGYKGATVPGFPNLFFLVGPNTTLGHSSMIYMIESQVAYLVDAWRRMRQHGLAAVEVDAAAEQAWDCDVQRRMRRTVWSTGCRSWYLDAAGRNVALWPRTSYAFRRLTARFDLPAYRATPADGASAGG